MPNNPRTITLTNRVPTTRLFCSSLSETSTELRKYSKHLYSTLEAETGLSTGFKPVGFIELASDNDYLEEFRRVRKHHAQPFAKWAFSFSAVGRSRA
jgi:glycine/D-amino acid oxidase-like deaminating enzyme